MKLFQGVLAFALAVTEDDQSNVTSHAGVPLVVEALLALKRASRAGPLPAC